MNDKIIKNTVGIHLNSIDKTVWGEFKNMTRLKHGKIHGALGKEVEKALLFYMKHDTHTQQIQTQKKMSNKERNFVKIAEKILKFSAISHQTLANLIIKTTSLSDTRTIYSYITSFIAMEWISEMPKAPQYLGIRYKIDSFMINSTLVRYEEMYNITFEF